MRPTPPTITNSTRRACLARRVGAVVSATSLLMTLGPIAHADAVTVPKFATESGRQIMTAAMNASKTQGSVTSSSATTISGQPYSSVTDSSAKTGEQTLQLGPAKSIVRVVGGTVYIKDDAAAIQAQFGVSAPKDANRWIEIPSTNSNFARFNSGILLSSMLSEVSPAGNLKTTTTLVVRHIRVVGVTGKPNIHLGLASGTETVYVATIGPHVPVELVASDVTQGQRQTFVITFTNWGKNFHIAQPASPLLISSTKLPG